MANGLLGQDNPLFFQQNQDTNGDVVPQTLDLNPNSYLTNRDMRESLHYEATEIVAQAYGLPQNGPIQPWNPLQAMDIILTPKIRSLKEIDEAPTVDPSKIPLGITINPNGSSSSGYDDDVPPPPKKP